MAAEPSKQWLASHGPLSKSTLDSLGMNHDALKIFVDRFENSMKEAGEIELLELLAKERLERVEERAMLVESISTSVLGLLFLYE